MDPSASPTASVVVVTHDRDEELAVCLASLAHQTIPLDVVVLDDKPGAKTRAVAERILPTVRYLHLAAGRGPAFQRNRGVEVASCEIVVSLDDDVDLVDPTTVERTLADFDDPRVGAVGIPFVNVRISEDVHHRSGDTERRLHAFVGAAHAVRRSAFLAVGGFREHFFYMGEEGDLAIRLAERGYVVRAGTAPPLHHFESPRRSSRRAAVCGRKNDVLFTVHNVPQPFLLPHLAATILNGVRFGVSHGHLGWHLSGLIRGFAEAVRYRSERMPVSVGTYKAFRKLKRVESAPPVAWTARQEP
jgi:glycosyltransferase involved in cell wall biosynthesis